MSFPTVPPINTVPVQQAASSEQKDSSLLSLADRLKRTIEKRASKEFDISPRTSEAVINAESKIPQGKRERSTSDIGTQTLGTQDSSPSRPRSVSNKK